MTNPFEGLISDKAYEEYVSNLKTFGSKKKNGGVKLTDFQELANTQISLVVSSMDEMDGLKDGGVNKEWLTAKLEERLGNLKNSEFGSVLKKTVIATLNTLPTKLVTGADGKSIQVIANDALNLAVHKNIDQSIVNMFKAEDVNKDGIADVQDDIIRKLERATEAGVKREGHGLPSGTIKQRKHHDTAIPGSY